MRDALRPREAAPGSPWWTDYTAHEFREILELARNWARLEGNVAKAAKLQANGTPPRDTRMREAQQDLLLVVAPAMKAHEKVGTLHDCFNEYVYLRSGVRV